MFKQWYLVIWEKLCYRRSFYKKSIFRKKELFGEYLINAQGEDVVAGTRTPKNLLSIKNKSMPKNFQQLKKIFKQLEKKYRDMQDIEFTVENNKLWMLANQIWKENC